MSSTASRFIPLALLVAVIIVAQVSGCKQNSETDSIAESDEPITTREIVDGLIIDTLMEKPELMSGFIDSNGLSDYIVYSILDEERDVTERILRRAFKMKEKEDSGSSN